MGEGSSRSQAADRPQGDEQTYRKKPPRSRSPEFSVSPSRVPAAAMLKNGEPIADNHRRSNGKDQLSKQVVESE